MPDKPKFRVYPRSFSLLLSAMLTFAAFVLLICVNWSVFYHYASGNSGVAPVTIVFYAVLIGSLLLFGLCILLFAKKTLIPAMLFTLPVTLFYLLDLSGLRQSILDFNLDNTLWHYRENNQYYRSSWWMILLLGALMIAASVFFGRFAFGRARRRLPGALITGASAAAWLAFSIYHVVVFDVADYINGRTEGLVFVFIVLTYTASACFFWAQFLLVLSAKRVPSAQLPLPVPMGADPFMPLVPAAAPDPLPAAAILGMAEASPAEAEIETDAPAPELPAEPAPVSSQHSETESDLIVAIDQNAAEVSAETEQETTAVPEAVAPAKKSRSRKKKAAATVPPETEPEPVSEPVPVD